MPNPFSPKMTKKTGPERIIQDKIKIKLTKFGWYIVETFGNVFQQGLPDLYACHVRYGARWIEVKNLGGSYHFTPAQLIVFREFAAKGIGVWVLGGDHDEDINLLFKPANWWMYL